MVRRELYEAFDGGLPLGQPLLRQPEHQIEADVVDSCFAGVGERLARAIGAVLAAEPGKLSVVERLDTEADAVDARVTIAAHPTHGDGFGIGLEGDFRQRREVERLSAGAHELRDFLGFEERRRAAAKEDSVGLSSIGGRTNLLLERGYVLALQALVE